MLTMRGGPQVSAPSVKMGRPPPVPPRPDKSVVADALAKSRKVPAPVLPPSLKKEPENPTEKVPSPKLNGLSRVKSFIRDVINDKKSPPSKEQDSKRSHIPISHPKISMNNPPEESIKNQSSQSVVRSLCNVLINDSKPKEQPITKEKVKIVKSNSFADKPVPVRRAPPPPISPKPIKKVTEEKLTRPHVENYSFKKLSASCEELNSSTPRPVVYQSPTFNKSASPVLQKRSLPPNLPPGRPTSIVKKRSNPNSPSTPNPVETDPFTKTNKSSEFGDDLDTNNKCATEMLISEIIAAKNDALVSQIIEKEDSIINKTIEDNIINISYNVTAKDNVSVCSSDGSSGGSKTILFINSESFDKDKKLNGEVISINDKHLDDISNHELLIYELQKMKREEDMTKGTSSPDSISAETQNIQHSDWVVEDNGNKVRYSSCQIVIEDSNPVDDSGICLNDNFYSLDNAPQCLPPSLISRLKDQFSANQKMSSLQGLPPLPKSLSGFNVVENHEPPPMPPGPTPPPVPARGPTSLRYTSGSPASPTTPLPSLNGGSSSSSTEMPRQRKPTTLDTQLALLKREMLSLRQLDLSLLSQLWSLNESIHEFRQYMNDRISGQGVPEDDDDMEDEGDDSSSGAEDAPHPHSHSHAHRGRTPV